VKTLIQKDYIRFVLPKDRELQFPAMAMVQAFVNNYDERMAANDVSGGRVVHELVYEVQQSIQDWTWWQRVLNPDDFKIQAVRGVFHPDMVIDMSDERLLKYQHSGKHACQVCGLFAGESCPALPTVKQLGVSSGGYIGVLEQGIITVPGNVFVPDLLQVKPNELSMVIGRASYKTYLACAMGIPVVEIVPSDRNPNWLSKWQNIGYRQVIAGEREQEQLESAIVSIRELLFYMAKKQQLGVEHANP
jgi:hypothetical protein